MLPETEVIEVGDLRIGYRRAGSGPPVVLIHGGLSDSREWRIQLEGLSDEFTVLAWDAPGCGASSDPSPTFRIPDYADCVAAWMAGTGFKRAHIVGLSFGSCVAIEFARRHSEAARSLTLASAYAGWAGSLPPDVVEQRLQGALTDINRPPEEVAREFVPSLLTPNAPEALVNELLEITADFRQSGARTMVHAMAEADLRDALAAIKLPTLLVYGAQDDRSPLAVAEEIRSLVADAALIRLRGASHQLNMEAGLAFNEELRRFLRRSAGQ